MINNTCNIIIIIIMISSISQKYYYPMQCFRADGYNICINDLFIYILLHDLVVHFIV